MGGGGREGNRERRENILVFIVALSNPPWSIFHSVLIG